MYLTFSYDGDGKRIKKFVGNQETIFVYNAAGQLVAEYQTNYQAGNVRTSYLTADDLGSPRVITDSTGAVQSRHDYMAFGEEIYAGVGGRSTSQKYVGDNIKQKFTGYQRDDETGLDYSQARYYSSQHGRFTSVDPLIASATIKNPQTFNRYSYALNSPYKFTDPLGLSACRRNPCVMDDHDPEIENDNPESIKNKKARTYTVDVTGDDPNDVNLFPPPEDPKNYLWSWIWTEKQFVYNPYTFSGSTRVGEYKEVEIGRTPIEAAGNDILNQLYQQVFAIEYTLEVLEGIKEIVGGEKQKLA